MLIRLIQDKDVNKVTDIYNYYVTDTIITFEEEWVEIADMSARIKKIAKEKLPWFVAEDNNGNVIGYAYATKWRERFAYRYSVEITVYVHKNATKNGVGSRLYEALLSELRTKKVHTVIGGITLPNAASIALHERFAMKQVAHFKEVGFKFKQWLDVGYWQVEL
jgi:phosphinothricin acetyltransferase